MNGQITQVETWFVPSQEVPGQYYEVDALEDGDAICNCRWGRKYQQVMSEDPTVRLTRCWHSLFAATMEHAEIKEQVGELVWRRAHDGHIESQMVMLAECAGLLFSRQRFQSAAKCYEVMAKYTKALSVQGAPTHEEAAAMAASTPCANCEGVGFTVLLDAAGIPSTVDCSCQPPPEPTAPRQGECGVCMGRGTLLTLDGEGCIQDDARETCWCCGGTGYLPDREVHVLGERPALYCME
jgi:hypothetical protein